MKVSRVVLGAVLAVSVVAVTGCKAELTVKTKTRYTTPPQTPVVREDSLNWSGEAIEISISGVGVAVNGGVHVTADPNAARVTAKSRMLAMAYSDEKPNADLSLNEATATFTLTHDGSGTGGKITIGCDHGGSHGSSSAGESGCELTEVTIPAGAAATPIQVKVLGGNGGVVVQLRGTVLGSVAVNSNGGEISAEIPSTVGATAVFVASKGDDIAVTLPTDWSADEVILSADAGKITNPFTLNATNGYGTAGAGLKTLSLRSDVFVESGELTLRN